MITNSTASILTIPTAPNDAATNTIPQQASYTTFLNATITPRHVNNILVIEVNGSVCAGSAVYCALFQDATQNALSTAIVDVLFGANKNINLHHTMLAGTTSSTTFKVGLGCYAATPAYANADASGTRVYGGVSSVIITVTEYAL